MGSSRNLATTPPVRALAAYQGEPDAEFEQDFAVECLRWMAELHGYDLGEGQMQAWLMVLRTDRWLNMDVRAAAIWCVREIRGFPYYSDFVAAYRAENAETAPWERERDD